MALSDVNRIISMVVPLPLFIVNIFVLYLSIKKVKSSLSRTFTLNMIIPSLGYSVYLIVLIVATFLHVNEHFAFRTEPGETVFVDYLTDFVYYLCTYEYRMLAILIIVLTYLSFAKPMFHQRLNQNREILISFAVAQIIAVIASVLSTTSINRAALKYVEHKPSSATHIPVTVSEVIIGCIDFFTFLVLVLFYIISLNAIVTFNYHNSQLHPSDSTKRRRMKAQLFATLAYITPPSVFLIPNSFCLNFVLAYIKKDVLIFDQLCDVKIRLHSSLLSVRLFLASAMVIVAFGDYRRAMKAVFKKSTMVVSNAGITVVQHNVTRSAMS